MNAKLIVISATVSVASLAATTFYRPQVEVSPLLKSRGYLAAQTSTRNQSSAIARSVMTATTRDLSTSNAALTSTLSSLGYQRNEAISLQAVTFDVPLIVDAWQRVRLNGESRRIIFMGHDTETKKILHSDVEANEDIKTLLFETDDQSGWVVLSINKDGDAVKGYAILGGKAYDIAPIPGKGKEEGKKIHAFVELNLKNVETGSIQDTRASKAVESLNRAIGTAGYDCKSNNVVKVDQRLSILVGYTPQTERRASNPDYGGPMAAKPLSEAAHIALESALQRAGVEVAVEALDPIEVPYTEQHPSEPIKTLDKALEALINGDDASMVEFRSKRREHKADIGVLLIDIPGIEHCGKAQLSASPANAYAVVNWRCMQGKQSFLHEVGHILGLYHQRDTTAVPSYAKAFMQASPENTRPFITLMGAFGDCKGASGCPRILRFSGPLQSYNHTADSNPVVIGVPEKVDNACVLRQTVPRVVQFGDSL